MGTGKARGAEIEPTPDMIEAGAMAIEDMGHFCPPLVAEAAYLAMEGARRRSESRHADGDKSGVHIALIRSTDPQLSGFDELPPALHEILSGL